MKLAPKDLTKLEKQFGSTILECPSYLELYANELNADFLEGEDPRKPFTVKFSVWMAMGEELSA